MTDDNNRSIEQIAEEEPVIGHTLHGTEEQLSFDLGSEYNLADSTLKIAPIPALTVEGQYQEGDRIKVIVEVEVEYVAFPPIKERGFRVGTERRHIAQVLWASQVEITR